MSGTPTKAGVTHLTIKATFGSGSNKYVVLQAFTDQRTCGAAESNFMLGLCCNSPHVYSVVG
jgi:hypothetical protein